MKITKIIIAVAFFVFCFSYMGSPVTAQDALKGGKGSKGGSSGGSVGHQGSAGYSSLKGEDHVYGALEELKLISNDVTKKTNVNRNLIIGSAVTNLLLLIVLSGLMGYSIKTKPGGGSSSTSTTPAPAPSE